MQLITRFAARVKWPCFLVNGEDPKKISGVISRDGLNLINEGDADVYKDIDLLPFPERDKFWAIPKEDVNRRCLLYMFDKRVPI